MPGDQSGYAAVLYGGQKLYVSSSNIRAFRYDHGSNTLLVDFKSGESYAYDDVPESVVEDWILAGSKGEYHYYNIRTNYTYHKL